MRNEAKWSVIILAVLFFGISAACWIKPAKDYSVTERRALEQFPEFTLNAAAKGSFMTDFETYTLDQFPMRDHFRRLKSIVSRSVFGRMDDHEIYVSEGYAVKMEYPLKTDALEYASDRFLNIYEKYLKNSGSDIYLSLIPDKNYFLAESSGHLSMDYEQLFTTMQDHMPYAEYIDITDLLEIEDYYKTDVHWRQEQIADAAKRLNGAMGNETVWTYEKRTLEQPFYGVYFGQSALDLPGEALHYLSNEMLDQCSVYNYETQKTQGIYDLEKAQGEDPYEVFLSGPVSLMKIENPYPAAEKELIVFRDSFASSLIPLLAESYRTVTLIDIRYIQSDFLVNFVDFTDKDVLFLYSTVVLNNSETLK